jgi:hypothetical protein
VVRIPPIAGPNAVPAEAAKVTAPIDDPLISFGRYEDTIASDIAVTIPAPNPCTARSKIIAFNPNPGKNPQRPIMSDDAANTPTPVMKTFLYPLFEPSFDHSSMKQHSISV